MFYFERKKDEEIQQKEAEIHFLKYQLSPHFLVNSINNLISKSVVSKKEITTDLVDLADWINYSLYDTEKKSIPLINELEQISRFVNKQKENANNPKLIVLTCNVSDETKRDFLIAPLIFFNYIENAFKYSNVQFLNENCFLRIDIKETPNNRIEFRIENSISKEGQIKGALGMKNVEKRLDLIYKSKYELVFTENANHFLLTLTLPSL